MFHVAKPKVDQLDSREDGRITRSVRVALDGSSTRLRGSRSRQIHGIETRYNGQLPTAYCKSRDAASARFDVYSAYCAHCTNVAKENADLGLLNLSLKIAAPKSMILIFFPYGVPPVTSGPHAPKSASADEGSARIHLWV